MRRSALLAIVLFVACVSPVADVSSFPPREGAVYSPDCCGVEHDMPYCGSNRSLQ